MKTVDFGSVAKEYLKYRDDIPESLLEGLEKRGVVISGSKVADLGAGPGLLSKMLSNRGAIVDAVEPSEKLVETGREFVGDDPRIKFRQKYAEDTGLKADKCDLVTVMRAWHWYDTEEVIKEIKRILKPGGHLIVMDSGFTSGVKIVKKSLKIIKNNASDKQLKKAGAKEDATQMINSFPVEWFDEWKYSRFDLLELYKMDYEVKFTNEEWLGRLATVSWLAAFKEKKRKRTLEEIDEYIKENFSKDTHKIPHVLSIAILENRNKKK